MPWLPTRQPIALEALQVTEGRASGPFTTVMQWDSYASRECDGCRFGMKSDSFAEFMAIPSDGLRDLRARARSRRYPLVLLSASGWRLRDPLLVTKDASSYQSYIRSSKGEFSVAKHGYVTSRSGWFSERSACYLASGRPAAVQDTGFTDWMEDGLGVVPFSTFEEAVDAVDRSAGDYPRHCLAARQIAADYFAAAKVLPALLERAA